MIVRLFLLMLLWGSVTTIISATQAESIGSRPRTVPELIDYWGYPVETHWVTTSDDYILTLHRIPPTSGGVDDLKPIAFLLHGLFGTSARWTLGPPSKSLGYILADLGFDVWLGNSRGNSYSRNHTTYNPDTDSAFWDFDIDSCARGDLPAFFDYIRNLTSFRAEDDQILSPPFFYICHSMGCAEILALLSQVPDYNEVLDAAFLMAPPVFMANSRASYFTGLASLFEYISGYKELRRYRTSRPWWVRLGCTYSWCRRTASRMLSMSPDQLNMTMLPVIYDHLRHGSSSKVVFHFSQLIEAGNVFRKYDYGWEENQSRYNGSMTPPHFNLSDISTPLYLFYGNGDKLIAEEDVLALTQSLPSCRALHKIDYPGWNHNDFVYAQDAKTLVYDSILNQMQDYLNNATKLDTEL